MESTTDEENIIRVGEKRKYKTLSEAIFLEKELNGKTILIDDGVYNDKCKINEVKKLSIIGSDNTIFQGKITIKSSFVIISNIIFYASPHNICIDITLTNLEIKDTIFFRRDKVFVTNYKCEMDLKNNFFIENGEIISNSKTSHGSSNTIKASKNLFYDNNEIISTLKQEVIFSWNKNVIFHNNILAERDYQRFVLNNAWIEPLEFINEQNFDFRFKDENFRIYGASEALLISLKNYLQAQREKIEIKKPILNNSATILFNYSNLEREKEDLDFLKNRYEEIQFTTIHSAEELKNQKSDVFFIINVADIHDEEDLAQNLLKVATEELRLQTYTCWLEDSRINIKKAFPKLHEFQEFTKKNYPNSNIFYRDLENLSQQIYNHITSNKSKVILQSLEVENIACFQEPTRLDFGSEVTCLLGLNGTGKTTLLRAAALALIGVEHGGFDETVGENLLAIGKNEGNISLTYSINGVSYESKMQLIRHDLGDVRINLLSDFPIVTGNHLKTLVIGFSQVRGTDKSTRNQNELLVPHVADILPLITNQGDNRLKSFEKWLIDLSIKASNKEKEANNFSLQTKEREIIRLIFEIFSAITGQEVRFLEPRSSDEVWVSLAERESEIPLSLLSQGFQSIIGWVGYFLQRLAQTSIGQKPLNEENAIVFIDEIDTYLHPQWQARIMQVLREKFPNTQFIITTHSPVLVNNLKQENAKVFYIDSQTPQVSAVPYFYGWHIARTLYDLYNLKERPQEIEHQIYKLFSLLDDDNVIEAEKRLTELSQILGEDDGVMVEAKTRLELIKDLAE
ncbi:MAG: hypothetical protein EAZ08_13055 [Cytophagales bacterium]|nr:MAG: hypothetical protein EAZ08_13055 [Cytophagales bacterium]